MLQEIMGKLEAINKGVEGLETGQKEIKQDIKNLDDKLDLLTRQTSNAVIENHEKQLVFLKDKVFTLEEQIYNLKRSKR